MNHIRDRRRLSPDTSQFKLPGPSNVRYPTRCTVVSRTSDVNHLTNLTDTCLGAMRQWPSGKGVTVASAEAENSACAGCSALS